MALHSRRHLDEFRFSVSLGERRISQHLRGTRFKVLTGFASLLSSLPLPSAPSSSLVESMEQPRRFVSCGRVSGKLTASFVVVHHHLFPDICNSIYLKYKDQVDRNMQAIRILDFCFNLQRERTPSRYARSEPWRLKLGCQKT